MLKYLIKNLKFLLTKQGVISLLLVINIVVSALVICFSYGLYQNYKVEIREGKIQEERDFVYFTANPDYVSENEYSVPLSGVTFGMVTEFARMLSDETAENIAYINVSSPFISEDLFDIGYGMFSFYFKINDGKLEHAFDDCIFPASSYNIGKKFVIVPKPFLSSSKTQGCVKSVFNGIESTTILIDEDTTVVEINNEEYEIIGYTSSDTYKSVILPVSSIAPDERIRYSLSGFINIMFKEPMSASDYSDIKQSVAASMGDTASLPEITVVETQEIYYYKTILIISLFIAILAAINMAILYRYILEKRSSELAILRICGCSKSKAVRMYLMECMLVNAPLFALTEYVYHKLIMSKLTSFFPHMEGAYSFRLYAAIFGIYVVASLFVMLVMITVTVRKHSLVEQKNISKAKSRFGIMKVFEIIQLSFVIGIAVFLVSAIASRYTYYMPFKDVLESKGYMISTSNTSLITTDEFLSSFSDYEVYATSEHRMYDNDNPFMGFSYPESIIKRYSPEIKDGVWLSETGTLYEETGYIPAVISSGTAYSVGDVIEHEAKEYDIDGNIIYEGYEKYKIVGVLEEKTNIVSYGKLVNVPDDFREIYGVFDNTFEEYICILVSSDDICSKYGKNTARLEGIHFVVCDNADDDEYLELGDRLKEYDSSFSVASLSEVNENSLEYIYEQMYTLFPIALCIFILTVISAVSINAIYTKRQLRNYAIFYICGARWRTCALKSLRDSAITCAVASALCALILFIGKQSFLKETVISFGIWHAVVCLGVIALYLILSMIMPIAIIGSSQPKDVLKEE